jgi:hypothetical protein
MMFEKGQPVKYRGRHFVIVRAVPGMPRQWVIRDDEDNEQRVLESNLSHA